VPRTAGRRTWIKLYPIDCLEGSIRYQLESDERGVWYDLLNLSAICATPGSISDKDGRPYPHSFIANRLNIPVELLDRTLSKCNDEGRISEDEHGVHITHWKAYQSEYQRQLPYRRKAREGKKIPKRCPVCKWKGVTDETTCPDCAKGGKETELAKDYKGGKYGHMDQE